MSENTTQTEQSNTENVGETQEGELPLREKLAPPTFDEWYKEKSSGGHYDPFPALYRKGSEHSQYGSFEEDCKKNTRTLEDSIFALKKSLTEYVYEIAMQNFNKSNED